jgi:hypothetical protein
MYPVQAFEHASAAVPRRLGFRLRRSVDDEVEAPGEIGRSMEWVVTRPSWAPPAHGVLRGLSRAYVRVGQLMGLWLQLAGKWR